MKEFGHPSPWRWLVFGVHLGQMSWRVEYSGEMFFDIELWGSRRGIDWLDCLKLIENVSLDVGNVPWKEIDDFSI